MKRYLLIILALSLPPLLWWFLPGYIIDGTDIIFPLDPILNFKRGFFAWDSIVNTGSSLYAFQVNLTKSPVYFYLSIFQLFNLPLWIINRIWYFTYLLVPAACFFLFFAELIWKSKLKYPLSLVGAVFYIYNLYYLQQIFDQAITLSYIFTPLVLFLVLKAVRTEKIILYAAFISLFSFFYSPINPNSYLIGIVIILSFLAALVIKFWVHKEYKKLIVLCKVSTFSLFGVLLVCAYVFWPTYFYLNQNVSSIQTESSDWLDGVSKTTSFFNVFRLAGAWDWYEKWNNEYYAPYAQIYTQNIFFIALSLIPGVLSLLGFIYSKNKWKYFFGFLGIMGIILAMGSHVPTGQIYYFLYEHMPLFWIFRSPWYKFSVLIVFAYSVLIALFAEILFKKYTQKKVIISLIVFFIFLSLPLFLGTRFTTPKDRNGNLASMQVKIPSYIFETSKWLNSQPGDERALMIPQIAWESSAYKWSYGNLVPPLYTLVEKNPLLFLPYDRKGPGIELLKAAKLSLYTPNSTPSANYLAFLNTKYLINQKDFSYFYFRAPEDENTVKDLIGQQREFSLIKSFGEWDIYQTDKYLPKIYSTNRIYSLKNLYEAGNLDIGSSPAFILESQKDNLELREFEEKTQLSYKKLSPVSYRISVITESPFYLIFSEAFDKHWKLNIENENYDHFPVNSYANGYLINRTGEYELSLEYLPQKYFNQGWKATYISAGFLVIIVIVLLAKEKMLKSRKENR